MTPARLTVDSACSRRSVPVHGLRVRPRAARGSVGAVDVAEAPDDLGRGVGLPVGAGARHLAAGQRLRDAGGTARRVVGGVRPAGLLLPQLVEALELVVAPAVRRRGEVTGGRAGAVGGVGRGERFGGGRSRGCGGIRLRLVERGGCGGGLRRLRAGGLGEVQDLVRGDALVVAQRRDGRGETRRVDLPVGGRERGVRGGDGVLRRCRWPSRRRSRCTRPAAPSGGRSWR